LGILIIVIVNLNSTGLSILKLIQWSDVVRNPTRADFSIVLSIFVHLLWM